MMYVAPFFGEFGWEVAVWVPWLRGRLSQLNLKEVVTIICKSGHEPLYTSMFGAAVKGIDPPKIYNYDCNNVWVDGHGKVNDKFYQELVCFFSKKRVTTKDLITPLSILLSIKDSGVPVPRDPIYDPYMESIETENNLVTIHARMCPNKQPERNWSADSWAALVHSLPDRCFAAVGHPDLSILPPGASDYRGRPLAEQMAVIARSTCIVGPSSGPLHLANFCAVPAIWWSANAKDIGRYETEWNPFMCKNKKVDGTWVPSADSVSKVVARRSR
jgi:hypothetical protein